MKARTYNGGVGEEHLGHSVAELIWPDGRMIQIAVNEGYNSNCVQLRIFPSDGHGGHPASTAMSASIYVAPGDVAPGIEIRDLRTDHPVIRIKEFKLKLENPEGGFLQVGGELSQIPYPEHRGSAIMTILTAEQLEEYASELEAMADEKKLGDETISACQARDKKIKARITAIAEAVHGPGRTQMPVLALLLEWDRRATNRGGDLDLDKLEAVIGAKPYKALCERRTVHDFSPEKFQAARASGEITDVQIAACTTPLTVSYSIYLNKMVPPAAEGEGSDEPEEEI